MINFRLQKLPILNPTTLKKISSENRVEAHSMGMWHPTVQAYIVKKQSSKILTLVQKRSHSVDIGKKKYDQSIAIHINDGESVLEALMRGVFEELGMDINRYRWRSLLKNTNLMITKTYEEDFSIFNRENLHLYAIEVDDNFSCSVCSKIDSYHWEMWDDYVGLTLAKPEIFTKTSRFYINYDVLRDKLEEEMNEFLSRKSEKENIVMSADSYHFISLYDDQFGVDKEKLITQADAKKLYSSSLLYNREQLFKLMKKH